LLAVFVEDGGSMSLSEARSADILRRPIGGADRQAARLRFVCAIGLSQW